MLDVFLSCGNTVAYDMMDVQLYAVSPPRLRVQDAATVDRNRTLR